MHTRTSSSWIGAIVAALLFLLALLATPVSAQYGGGSGMTFFVTPVRVPIDQAFSGFGTGCDAGSTVEITIDGVPGLVATSVADASDGTFSAVDITVPDGLAAGTDQGVRATCNAESTVATITLVCPSGDDPVDGSCEDGSDGITGGVGPTTTSTTPDGSGTTTGGSSPTSGSSDTTGGSDPADGSAGTTGGSGGGDSPPLAFTGAAFTGRLLQGAVTLMGLGALLMVMAKRRASDVASAA